MHKHCDTAVTKPTAKATPLALAMAAALGLSGLSLTAPAAADSMVYLSWQGNFTLLNVAGISFDNRDYTEETTYYGWRTPISGTFSFNLTTGAGTGTIDAFTFATEHLFNFTNLSMQAIGNGMGGPGTLVLGNMGFNWSSASGVPVSIVWDAAGLFSCLGDGYSVSETCTGVGALAASDNTKFGSGRFTYTMPMGPAPIATTTWNTTTIGGTNCGMGCNPSGTLPLVADTNTDHGSHPAGEIGIGGSPMVAGPFPGWNINLDILSLHIYQPPQCTSCPPTSVPIPAAAWLFGSGLLGLLGLARRRLRQGHG